MSHESLKGQIVGAPVQGHTGRTAVNEDIK